MVKLKLKSESTGKSVVFSTVFSLVAKSLTFVQAMIVSYYFGATGDTDMFFFCVSLIMLLPGLFNNINQAVIVPNAIKIRETRSREESHRFVLYVYLFYVIAGLIGSVAASLAPQEFMMLVSRFGMEQVQQNIIIVKLMIPTFFFVLVNTYVLNVFTSYKYFTFPMVSDMIKSLLIIAFIAVFGTRYGVASMAAGVLAAHVIQFFLLNYMLVKLLGFKFKPHRYRFDTKQKRNVVFVVVSQTASILNQYIAIYLISGLSDGVYSALSYSNKIFNLLVLVFVGQVSTVVGINMIELYAKKVFDILNREFLKYVKVTMTVLLPVSFILSFQSVRIISVLLERGRFDAESVQLTSMFFRFIILMIPVMMLDRLVVRLIIARQIMHVSFIWNVIGKVLSMSAVFVIINYADYRYYTLGLVLVEAVYVAMMYLFLVRKHFRFIDVPGVFKYMAASICTIAAVSYGFSGIFSVFETVNVLQKAAVTALYGGAVLAGYYMVGYVMGYNRETLIFLMGYVKRIKARLPWLSGNLKA